MKILRLLNRKILFLIFILFSASALSAEEQPVDIWNIEKKQQEKTTSNLKQTEEEVENNSSSEFEIFDMQKQKENIK